ncbi:ATPase and DNA damage recognition protein of nucleotide excision repair excinuclease UvrABC [Tenacibaculum maritimum]|uniref:excinuclease ABC subunit UvrA n=1 Tax=Tenacibaculum maritimum TaxID=107401 RepID=UPI0012E605D7|nr:excinuclease ABC subunit UvrA [Tenacibaculum maritimum]CAA0180664.1 ATPase and DNA damage recognition protein of nucleotide excision repair excinuclease UvrABC [Tenacibaculum maritimum]CAA0191080.1 ATPase and DNA damage recognition protein of nucleotide excision repair excinuclease UvrABC [Tenacibaculum maritimum]CAA0257584.1 ATPase and DNA damage recognition protein of nucleotide excision repair excinuclease UvrABC [Tenacibaculum maritimum]
MKEQEYIEVYGARAHNLKNIDVKIPREKLVVITGLSGSGKSSLAFDTIYAEGQRRYIETFSAYARQFLGGLERPDVDKIEGLSPVISIEQKTTNKSPRSTVGTITEIYDFLRLLFSRASEAYSFNTGEKMISYSDEQIKNLILKEFTHKKVAVLAPLIKSRKGHYRELFEQISKQGFVRVRVDGKIREIEKGMRLDRYKTHDIEVVIDRLLIDETAEKRLEETIKTALYTGNNILMVIDVDDEKPRYFSRELMCPTSGIAYPNPEPNTFSFNSPKGACPNCNGLGITNEVNKHKIIPDHRISIKKGGIAPLGEQKNSWIFKQLQNIAERYQFKLTDPIEEIPKKAIHLILHGGNEKFEISSKDLGVTRNYEIDFEGVISFIKNQYNSAESSSIKRWAKSFMDEVSCTTCDGKRLKKEALHFKILDKNISDLARMDVVDLANWFKNIDKKLSQKQLVIASEILKEIKTRIQFLVDVGLDYLTIDRTSKSLSGGEAQRIRLATQIGSQLVGVLYILDEPSIGLHQRDNEKLIQSLIKLRNVGNSVLVVEHDKDMIEQADFVLDIGPGAGRYGGTIVSEGSFNDLKKHNTLTADYLTNRKAIEIPPKRRIGNGNSIQLKGASGNNLKNVSVEFPLGKMICVTGVSGSGKSTLINETLYPILNAHIYRGVKKPMPYKKIEGLEHIDKIIDIDQSPIGRTPRSNPATYTGTFGEIRSLFAKTPEAAIRGYKPGRFSFNVKGGRCETCQGGGVRVIEMNFLPDVHVECETCQGKRFNRETLEIRYKGKSIADVLAMTINEATDFFEHIPKIFRKLKTIKDVGLGYITLGQQSTTLSGGEAQRIKLASELSKRDTGNTFYILDEPTTGLHFEDIRVLMEVLNKLTDKGNTVLIIEHNLDVIKLADHIIDIGMEGGKNGGQVLCTGTPEQIIKHKTSYTAKFLKKELL